jgi:hypothetical protein
VTTVSRDSDSATATLPWPYGAPAEPQSYRHPMTATVTPIRPVPGRRDRPVHAADLAQARLFSDILRREIAELEDVAETAERRWLQQRVRGAGDDTLPQELVRLGERVAEAHRLLAAMQARFSHG